MFRTKISFDTTLQQLKFISEIVYIIASMSNIFSIFSKSWLLRILHCQLKRNPEPNLENKRERKLQVYALKAKNALKTVAVSWLFWIFANESVNESVFQTSAYTLITLRRWQN